MSDIQNKIQDLIKMEDSIEKLIQLGDLYLLKGDIVEARKYYNQATEKYPDEAEPYYKLAEMNFYGGEYVLANDYYEKATDLDGSNARYWLGYAKIQLKLNGLSRADKYIDKAVALDPENPEILLYAGIIKLKIHDIYFAEKYLTQLEQIADDSIKPYVYFYLGLLYSKKSLPQKATDYYSKIIESEEFNSDARNRAALKNNLALCLMKSGNPQEAEKILRELIESGDEAVANDPSIRLNFAMTLWIQDKIDEAKDILKSLDESKWMWKKELDEYTAKGKDWIKANMENLLKENPDGYNIVLFLGCVIPNRYPFIETASRFVLDKLGVGVDEAEGAGCCPAPGVFRSFDLDTWRVLAARNITISEQKKRDFVTMCNGCYGTLNDVDYELKHNKEERDKVNKVLKEIGREYQGSVQVRHIVDVLYNEIGIETLKKYIVNRFDGLKVAVHYGCHILKPHFNKPWPVESVENPTFLDELVEITGAKSVPYKDKLMCCGAGGAVRSWTKLTSLHFTKRKLENMREAGADIIIDCCPFCHLQFDLGQVEINSGYKDELDEPFNIPVVYITQLLGMAMGMDPFRLGMLKTPKQSGAPPFVPLEPFFTERLEDINIQKKA